MTPNKHFKIHAARTVASATAMRAICVALVWAAREGMGETIR